MGMSRCYSLMKCLLILFNVIFLCLGCGVCAFAGWALWDGRASETGSGRAGLCAVAIWGAILTLGAITALAGAVRGSASLLAACFALLALSAVAEGAAAWWGAAHLPRLRVALSDRLHHTVTRDYGLLPARTHIIDAIQTGLECCGATGSRDWQQSAWANGETGGESDTLDLSVAAEPAYYYVPPSCCMTKDNAECEVARRVPAASSTAPGLHTDGCSPRVLHVLGEAARAPLLAGATFFAAHLLALLLALALTLRAAPANNYKA
ncbi:unnamed protein product [Leptosia nina]|uniref:Tetraspanin n=1 Tax=Leptosia nina TaxID=320188 RepID=A0AAV1J1V3_9NEOP